MNNILNIEDLEKFLSQNEGKHILKIGNSTCVPCKMVQPFMEQFVDEYPDVSFYTLTADEVDDNGEVGRKLRAIGISSVPTFIINEDGVETRKVGAFSKTTLKEALNLA